MVRSELKCAHEAAGDIGVKSLELFNTRSLTA
jgi:hypothetical protein